MKFIRNLVLACILIFILTIAFSDAKSEKSKQSLPITSLTIQFEKTDAIFTVDYDLGRLPRLYIMLIGAKDIGPMLRSVFFNFDYKIIKIDQDEAILKVQNISRFDKGYYLHDSRKFGETIKTVYIYTPDSLRRGEYNNINSTPYYFYHS